MPILRIVIASAICIALSGCGENADPSATVTFTNGTEQPIVRLVAPTIVAVEEAFAAGFPPNRAILPGAEVAVAMNPPDLSAEPLCVFVAHYFYHLRDPSVAWEPREDESLGFDDLVLIEVLQDPCWPTKRSSYTVTGN